MRDARNTTAGLLSLLIVLLAGCSSGGSAKPTDLVQRGTVRVQTVPSQTVLLAPPRVTLKAGITTIAGDVSLAPGAAMPTSGTHVQIEALDANGRELDRMRVGWTPDALSEKTPSHYHLSSLWTPQPGTVLRLAVVSDDAADDDTLFASSSGGAAGGKSMPGNNTGIKMTGNVQGPPAARSSRAPSMPGHSHR